MVLLSAVVRVARGLNSVQEHGPRSGCLICILKNKKNIEKPKYSLIARIFHWGFVFLFAYGLYKQVQDLNQLEDIALLKFEILFASFFLILLICRFFYMKKTQKTSLPENTNRAQKIAAKTVHYSMYVTLASIPLTGIIIGFIYWIGFKDGFMIDTMITIHESSIY